MDMIDNYEKVIRKQEEVIAALEKQHTADQVFIDSQKQQIHLLQEKLSLLEEEKQALTDTGNGLATACEKLEELCRQQQELIGSFSGLFSEQ